MLTSNHLTVAELQTILIGEQFYAGEKRLARQCLELLDQLLQHAETCKESAWPLGRPGVETDERWGPLEPQSLIDFLQAWSADGMLQSFNSREQFRNAARLYIEQVRALEKAGGCDCARAEGDPHSFDCPSLGTSGCRDSGCPIRERHYHFTDFEGIRRVRYSENGTAVTGENNAG